MKLVEREKERVVCCLVGRRNGKEPPFIYSIYFSVLLTFAEDLIIFLGGKAETDRSHLCSLLQSFCLQTHFSCPEEKTMVRITR